MRGKDIIKQIILEFRDSITRPVFQRKFNIPINSDKIITLSGVRRSGKTHILYQTIFRLLEKGVPEKRIVYLNFEDERLDVSEIEPDLILSAYMELYSSKDLSKVYFFFDEIQLLPGWERFLRRVYDTVSKKIFITGSNSKLLSKEIATSLRGRTVTFEVFPFSFREYLEFSNISLSIRTKKEKALVLSKFLKYLHSGGFPEVIKSAKGLRDKILQEYFNVMIFADIIERFDISQTAVLKYFCKRAIGATGGFFSVNKIYNEIKSQGYKISKTTLYQYQDNIEAIYLSLFLQKFSDSVIKSELSNKKIYSIDTGFASSINHKLSLDKGRLLENLVFLEHTKKGIETKYFQDGDSECDFVTFYKDEPKELIQVSLSLEDDATRAREIRGLENAMKSTGINKGLILTLDESGEIKIDKKTVKIMPAYEYFL